MTWQTHPSRPPDPIQSTGCDDQPEDAAQEVTVVKLPDARDQQAEDRREPRILHGAGPRQRASSHGVPLTVASRIERPAAAPNHRMSGAPRYGCECARRERRILPGDATAALARDHVVRDFGGVVQPLAPDPD